MENIWGECPYDKRGGRMSKYKGLFTFDVENHRYLPVEQADGLIAEMECPEDRCPLCWYQNIDALKVENGDYCEEHQEEEE